MTRTASEWREFWRERGERELAELMRRDWTPQSDGHTGRIKMLLASDAPPEALAAELGRIRRDELGIDADDAADERAAASIAAWFAGA